MFLGLALACAGGPPRDFPPPDPSRATATERLGYEIYELDQAAWVASDVIRAAELWSDGIQGWIVVPSDAGHLVRFVGECGEAPCAYVDIQTSRGAARPVAARQDPPAPLPEDQAAMWRARDAALRSGFRACTPRYNTVVLPEMVADQWRVYLLAASQDPDEIVLTGHHRVTVSADGRSVRSSEPLSKSCVIDKRPHDAPLVALIVTHILDPEPIETHVFTSLNYGVILYVATERGTFKVEGASIELADPR